MRRRRPNRPRAPRRIPGLTERLREVIGSFGSTTAAAVAVDRSEGALRKWLRGQSEPSASDIRRLCEGSGYVAEWFLFGTGLHGRCERASRTLNGTFMPQQRASEILLGLVNGVDPLTQEDLPKGTILEKADVVRALLIGVATIEFAAARELRRKQFPQNTGRTWTGEENGQLVESFQAREPIAEIAARHGRTVRAIKARLEKLGLVTAEQRITVDRLNSGTKDAANAG